MSEVLITGPAEVCSWCGRENSQRLPSCAGCGTRLVAETQPEPGLDESPQPKSRVLAVCLALLFGPLGLIYVQAWGTMLVMILVFAPFIITHRGGLWITLGARLICAAFAYTLVKENSAEPNAARDATRLLTAAARLEGENREQAILAYADIIRLYPNTRASKEAASNIETLKRSV
jgi:hypothetical protein